MITWVDVETTGLDPETCSLIEIAVVVTNDDLEIQDFFTSVVSPEASFQWEEEAHRMHKDSGLCDLLDIVSIAPSIAPPRSRVEDLLLEFYAPWATYEEMPLAGSSVHFDRAFLKKYFPKFHEHLHYRNIDVSTMKEIVSRTFAWDRDRLPPFKVTSKHRALNDVLDSIDAMKYYTKFLVWPDDA